MRHSIININTVTLSNGFNLPNMNGTCLNQIFPSIFQYDGYCKVTKKYSLTYSENLNLKLMNVEYLHNSIQMYKRIHIHIY